MVNFRQSFPGKKEGDKVIIYAKKHWMRYAIVACISVLLLTIPLVIIIMAFIGRRELDTYWIELLTLGIGIYLLFLCGIIFKSFVDFYLDTFVVTEDKIIYIRQNGYFFQQIDEINICDIEEVAVDVHGFLRSFLDYGNLIIHSGSDIAVLTIDNIPCPHKIARQLMDMRREHAPKRHTKEEQNEQTTNVVTDLIENLKKEIKDL